MPCNKINMKTNISIADSDRKIILIPENLYDKKVLEMINDADKAFITAVKKGELGYSQKSEIESVILTLDFSVEK